MSYPGTEVTSVGQGPTTADTVADKGTGDNFTCSTVSQRMSNAMGVSSAHQHLSGLKQA